MKGGPGAGVVACDGPPRPQFANATARSASAADPAARATAERNGAARGRRSDLCKTYHPFRHHPSPPHRAEERGAALIIAVAIFTVLLIIGLTFYSSSRLDLTTATNAENAFRTAMIADAGLSLAVSTLQKDKEQHPAYTSLDHGLFTYFNGAWLAGKPWAFPAVNPDPAVNPSLRARTPLDRTWVDWSHGIQYKRVPAIDYWAHVKTLERDLLLARRTARLNGDIGFETQLAAVKAPLFVPRFQLTPDFNSLVAGEFAAVTPSGFGDIRDFPVQYVFNPLDFNPQFNNPLQMAEPDYDPNNTGFPSLRITPEQMINWWADVDNDGDGLRDSMWIPIPVERFFGGVDRDGDGSITAEEGGDGIDNDLDGVIDEADEVALFVYWGGNDGLDNDGDGQVDEADEQRVFLTAPLSAGSYWGGNDGLDNDGDGLIDEDDEQRVFLTADDGLDNDGDGSTDEVGEEIPFLNTFTVLVNQAALKQFANQQMTPSVAANLPDIPASALTIANPADPAGPHIDRLDNDFSMIINDVRGYAYVQPPGDESSWTAEEKAVIAPNRAREYQRIADVYGPLAQPNYNIVTVSGEPVCQIAGRVAVLITDENSRANLNTVGAITATTFTADAASEPYRLSFAYNDGVNPGEFDLRTVPGIGVNIPPVPRTYALAHPVPKLRHGNETEPRPAMGDVFDNTYGFYYQYFFDRNLPGYGFVDDNASTLWMMNDGVDNNGDGIVDELWEGIDEPNEFQLYRPLRNRLAELDGFDNDGNDALDEIGELGDMLFRTGGQIETLLNRLPRTSATTTPMDASDKDRMRNILRLTTTVQSSDRNARLQFYARDDNGEFALDSPPVSGIKLDYNYALAESIALALKQDWGYAPITDSMSATGDPRLVFNSSFADPPIDQIDYLRGLRREDTTMVDTPYGLQRITLDPLEPNPLNEPRPSPLFIEADPELRAYQLGLDIQEARDRDHARNVFSSTITDWWWRNVGAQFFGLPLGEEREITYTQAGVESIRINEIMVRPVRRVEAESNVDVDGNGTIDLNEDPNAFSNVVPDFDIQVTTMDEVSGAFNTPSDGEFWEIESSTNYLGSGTVWTTDSTDLVDSGSGGMVRNAIQFRIGPSAQLPPGRYYLMVNTSDENGNPSAGPGTGTTLIHTVKYATSAQTDILQDEINRQTGGGFDPFDLTGSPATNNVLDPIYGRQDGSDALLPAAPLSGWALLPTRAGDQTAAMPSGADGYAGIPGPGNPKNEAFTVIIPPFAENPADQLYLFVAIAKDSGPGFLSINFLEFSQEPDHEWVEIVNIAEGPDPIDVSGWQLEVQGDINGRGRIIGTIPNGTFIAPGGSLLLGTNKYDIGSTNFADDVNFGNVSVFAKNGIGLVRGPVVPGGNPDFSTISEPPIPRYITPNDSEWNPAQFGNIIWGVPLGITENGGSVFFRNEDVDFVDVDGDGLTDLANRYDDLVLSTSDTVPFSGAPFNFRAFAAPATSSVTKAWDRIVQLNIQFMTQRTGLDPGAGTVTEDRQLIEVAELVLRGGIFPNYPDFDLIDNDQDAGTLDNDGIDNDGDGSIDEGSVLDGLNRPISSNGVDDDGNGLIDLQDPNESEGVDEGRFRRRNGDILPGSYADDVIPEFAALPAYASGGVGFRGWKEFVERRFYPGESVVITLYEGNASDKRIADRVTYTQQDVENRSMDDVLGAPTEFVGIGFPGERWPDNTMGVDFYRSLERKHPLYTGDRFGTQNRWQATDGNYDDWHAGTNRFYDAFSGVRAGLLYREDGTVRGFQPIGVASAVTGLRFFGHGFSGSPLRANYFARALEWFETRDTDGNGDPDRYVMADLRATDLPPTDIVVPDTRVGDNFLLFQRAKVRNANLRSPGDLMTVPHLTMTAHFGRGELDFAGWETLQGANVLPEQYGAGVPAVYARPADIGIKGPMLGMDNPKDLRALIHNAAMDSIVLSVGQADFYPLYPRVGQIVGDELQVQFEYVQQTNPVTGINEYYPRTGPRAWTPVFLLPLIEASSPTTAPGLIYTSPSGPPFYPHLRNAAYPIQLNFLTNYGAFTPPPALSLAQLVTDPLSPSTSRWPLDLRAVMYVSSNRNAFDPLTFQRQDLNGNPPTPTALVDEYPAEALFVWDGADGLPNGEYDVYVATLDDVNRFVEPNTALAQAATHLAQRIATGDSSLTAVDIEFFTDTNGDRQCWFEDGTVPGQQAGLPDTLELGILTSPGQRPERFGLKAGLAPSTDGLVHYGVVKVENNYLGMFIRNTGSPNQLNRVSRVVLTSRDRTPGRININTTYARMHWLGANGGAAANDDATLAAQYDPFNTLMGLPGILGEFANNSDPSVPGQFDPRPFPDLDDVLPSTPVMLRALLRSSGNPGFPGASYQPGIALGRGLRHMDFNNDGVLDDVNGSGDLDPEDLFVRLDGRYYEFTSELVARGDNSVIGARPLELLPSLLADGSPALEGDPVVRTVNRFDEIKERFTRIANGITARSDTFEITVTAQSGYVFDADGDGVLNWRDDNEFRVTGERKTRTIYER